MILEKFIILNHDLTNLETIIARKWYTWYGITERSSK